MNASSFLQRLRSPWLQSRSLDLLGCALVLSVGAVLLTNDVKLPDKLLHWVVLPALLLVLATRAAWLPLQSMQSLRRGVQQTSLIALSAILYIVAVLIATRLNYHKGPGLGLRPAHYLHFGFGIAVYVIACAYAAADPRRLRAMMIAIAALVAVHAAINIVMFVNQPAAMATAGYRLFAVFGTPLYRNATHIAPLAAMFGMALLGLVATTRSRNFEQRLAVPCILILVLAVLMTEARGAIVAVFACALVLALISRRTWRDWILGLSTAAIAAIVLVPWVRASLIGRADSFRIALSKSYLQLAAQRPWSGFGLDRELIVTINNTAFEQPHNAFVWAALRGGVPALLLAAMTVLLAIYWSYRYWRVTGNAALLVLMLALGVTAMTEIGFLVLPYNWVWLAFWLPIGLAAGAERAVRQRLVTAPSLRAPRYVVPRMNVEVVVDRAAKKLKINFARSRDDVEALAGEDNVLGDPRKRSCPEAGHAAR